MNIAPKRDLRQADGLVCCKALTNLYNIGREMGIRIIGIRIMRYTESKQRKVSRHFDSSYRIQKREPKHMSILCETAPTMRNGVIKISTTYVGEGFREHGLALGQHLGRLP